MNRTDATHRSYEHTPTVDNYAKLRYGASAEKKSNTVSTSPYDILLPTKEPTVADRFCRFPTTCAMENTPAGEKAGESREVPDAVVEGSKPRTSKK
jgi:hypothetical protein